MSGKPNLGQLTKGQLSKTEPQGYNCSGGPGFWKLKDVSQTTSLEFYLHMQLNYRFGRLSGGYKLRPMSPGKLAKASGSVAC